MTPGQRLSCNVHGFRFCGRVLRADEGAYAAHVLPDPEADVPEAWREEGLLLLASEILGLAPERG